MTMLGRVLIIAGSDSGGGAGIQADIKTITVLGAYAATAITALTAQNTLGVHGIHEVPLPFLKQQIDVVLSDIGADVIKTGMLHSAGVVETVAASLPQHIPLVLDPVITAKGGQALLENSALSALKSLLLPKAYLLTPNAPEAALLTGLEVNDTESMKKAAESLKKQGAANVLVKGGHIEGSIITNILLTDKGFFEISNPRIHTKQTHGTGCTLASAIAAYLSQKDTLETAVAKANDYVAGAIKAAPSLGQGAGPINHMWQIA